MRSSTHQKAAGGALAQLDGRYRAPLMAFFRRRVKSNDEVEDLTQEVLLRVVGYADTPGFDLADRLIFTVASNLLRDRARRMKSRHANMHIVLELEAGDAAPDALIEGLSPERVLISKEALDRTLKAFQGLSPRTREVFVLYRLEGFRRGEIAQRLGISVSAVEKQIANALKHLGEAVA